MNLRWMEVAASVESDASKQHQPPCSTLEPFAASLAVFVKCGSLSLVLFLSVWHFSSQISRRGRFYSIWLFRFLRLHRPEVTLRRPTQVCVVRVCAIVCAAARRPSSLF